MTKLKRAGHDLVSEGGEQRGTKWSDVFPRSTSQARGRHAGCLGAVRGSVRANADFVFEVQRP